ncbi:hypothetical protein [Kribbella caucasensis]|nr:hypothetical protein [Kribbella sp. VKM Ac-2527]
MSLEIEDPIENFGKVQSALAQHNAADTFSRDLVRSGIRARG